MHFVTKTEPITYFILNLLEKLFSGIVEWMNEKMNDSFIQKDFNVTITFFMNTS